MNDQVVTDNNTAAPAADSAPAPETSQVTDLDGLSEFTFQGNKYTPDQFHKMTSEHKTYSEQIKSYESERQFVDNLAFDIENVLERPELASRFKATYPQKYHAVLDKYLKAQSPNPAQATAQQQQQASMPKEFMTEFEQMKQRLNFHEQRTLQAETDAASAKLEAMLPPIFSKYPLANDVQVYLRAEDLLRSGQKLTEKTWERLARESHESTSKKTDQFYSQKMKSQIEKGQKGSDIGTGGGTPGQAPIKPRTFAEATEAAIASLRQRQG